MAALARRDLELARKLPELDDPLDRLNRGMLQQVLGVSDDKQRLEWGIRMYVVSRQIERIGDNAVDIGEQWPSWSQESSTSSPTPRIRRSNIPSCWNAACRRSRHPCRPGQPPVHDREGGRTARPPPRSSPRTARGSSSDTLFGLSGPMRRG